MIKKNEEIPPKLILKKGKIFYSSILFIIVWELCSVLFLSYIGYTFFSSPYARQFLPGGVLFGVFGILVLIIFPIHMTIMAWPKSIAKKENNEYEIKTIFHDFIVKKTDLYFLKAYPKNIPVIRTNLGRIKLVERSYVFVGKGDREHFWKE